MMKPLNARTTSILKDNRTSANKVNGGSDSLEKENFLPIHKLKLLKRIKVFLIDALQFENLPRLFIENVEIVSTEYSPNGKYINVFWRPLDSKLEKEILKKLEEVAVDLEKVLQRLLVLRMGKGGIKVPTIPSLKFKRDYSDKEEIENIMNKIEIEIKNLKI
ncbi:hypothetical protein HK099_003050 [Clydaea vesicula]|uniref:Ribosome-binding factor A n=1 Tax=Clydaea vesicula TaxID=447962 RepID=A0AAD5U267_9FUNG|nr:hypothetical protein HK099_003050 [Clydaea vesicula]